MGVLRPRMAWALAYAVLASFLPSRVGGMLSGLFGSSPAAGVAAVAATATIVALGVLHGITVRTSPTGRRAWWLLGSQVVLTFAPYVVLGPSWTPIGALLGASILLTVRGSRAWWLFGAVVVGETLVAWWTGGWSLSTEGVPVQLLMRLQSPLMYGLLLFGVGRLAQLVQQRHETREQLAAAEVERFRLETAAGLRAAIGQDLAAIVVDVRRAGEPGSDRRVLVDDLAERSRQALASIRAVADLHRKPEPEHPPVVPPAATPVDDAVVARRILAVAAVSFAITVLLNLAILADPAPWEWGLTILGCAAVGVLHLRHAAPREDGGTATGWPVTLALQIAVAGGLLAWLGLSANPMSLLAIGAVLVLVPPPWSIVTGLAWTAAILGLSPAGPYWLYMAAVVLGASTSLYALHRFPAVARDLYETRRSVAQVAVARDRARVARDVHDLLGYHLSALTLQAELLGRELARGADDVSDGIAELGTLAERALVDVRSISDASTSLALDEELVGARSVLEAAGATVTIDHDDADVPPALDGLLATVLREAVTNVVRHADATSVAVRLHIVDGTVELRVENDGVGRRVAGSSRAVDGGGAGLDNLTARVEAAGGRLHTEAEGRTFRLAVTVPIARTTGAAPASAGSR